MMVFSSLAALLGTGGALGGAAAGTAATLGTTGLSLASVLQGAATVGGLVSAVMSGQAEGERADAEAADAEREKTFETVQAHDRQRQTLRAAAEALGEQDAAYASSGVDLSFGSAAQARKSVFRDADLAGNTNAATASLRLDRLTERAENLRKAGKRARAMGVIGGLAGAAKGFSSILETV